MVSLLNYNFPTFKFEHFIVLCIASVPALSLSVNSGYSYGSGILALLAIAACFRHSGKKYVLTREDKYLLLVFLLYFFAYLLTILLDGFHFREMDRPSKFLLAGLILLFLLRYDLNYEFLLKGIIAGAISGGIVALYQNYILNVDRAYGFQMAISFGNGSMLLGLLAFTIGDYYFWKKNSMVAFLSILAGFMGLLGSFYSGSRGGWLALPLLVFIIWQYRSLPGPKKILITAGVCFVFIALIALAPKSVVKNRISIAVNEFTAYFDDTNIHSSTGYRFEMWKSAYYSFLELPITGVGEYGSAASKQKQMEKGLINKKILHFKHSHNEYLNALSKRGIVGFSVLLGVYLIPLWLFLRRITIKNEASRVYAICGSLVVMCYMIFGFTQSSFSHNNGVVMYSSMIMFFWAAIRNNERLERSGIV